MCSNIYFSEQSLKLPSCRALKNEFLLKEKKVSELDGRGKCLLVKSSDKNVVKVAEMKQIHMHNCLVAGVRDCTINCKLDDSFSFFLMSFISLNLLSIL